MTHVLIILYLSVNFFKFVPVVYKLLLRHDLQHNLTFDPIVAWTMGIGTTPTHDTPSHYALSFCEVSLNLLQ